MDFYWCPLWIPWYNDPSHTRPTVVPTHHYILSYSLLMLPRRKWSPSMISPSPSFNHSQVATWIYVGSPAAGITLSSYLIPISPTTSGPSNTKTLPMTVVQRSTTSISSTILIYSLTSKWQEYFQAILSRILIRILKLRHSWSETKDLQASGTSCVIIVLDSSVDFWLRVNLSSSSQISKI